MDITTQKVIEVLADQLGIDTDDISLDYTLVEDLWFDSLNYLEVAMTLEEELNITMPDELMTLLDTNPKATVRDLIDLIKVVEKAASL